MIGILDYGVGNLKSIGNALHFLNLKHTLVAKPEDLDVCRALILPGVGSFGYAVGQLQEKGLRVPLEDWLKSGRPLLGICLGLQLLMDSSQESPGAAGLGVFKGSCRKFSRGKVPHIGWNRLSLRRPDNLLAGIQDKEFFYFAHSYYPEPETVEDQKVVAVSHYGREFAAVLREGRACGVQFHPEKSGLAGLLVFKNWSVP